MTSDFLSRPPRTGKRRRLVIVLVGALLLIGAASTAYALTFAGAKGQSAAQDPGRQPGISPTTLAELPDDADVPSKEPKAVPTLGGTAEVSESKKPKPKPSGMKGGNGARFTAAFAGSWGSEWFSTTLEQGKRSAVLRPASGMCTWNLKLTKKNGASYDAAVSGQGECSAYDSAKLTLDGAGKLMISLKSSSGAPGVDVPLDRR